MVQHVSKLRRRLILRFLDNFFANFWRNILPFFLMLLFGIYYFFSIKPTYLSHGVLYVQDDSLLTTLTNVRSNNYIWVSRGQTVIEQFDSLMQTDAFARAILQRTNWEQSLQDGAPLDDLLDDVRNNLWGEIKGEKHVHIVAQSDDPEIAFQLADAAITLYRQWKVNLALSDVNNSVGFLQSVMDDYQVELSSAENALRTYLIEHPDPAFGLRRPGEEAAQIAILTDDVSVAERRILETRAKIDLIKLDQTQARQEVENTYLLIDSPKLPLTPEYTVTQRVIVLFIFIGMGILLCIGAGIGATLMDKTYRYPVDIHTDLYLPVLGRIPAVTVALPAEMLGVIDEDEQLLPPPIHLTAHADTPPTLIILPSNREVIGA
jgi:capsular polysaccharide biosynthesis protein